MPLPASMRYIDIREPGPPDVLVPAEGPLPAAEARRGADRGRVRRREPPRLPAARRRVSAAGGCVADRRSRSRGAHRGARRRRDRLARRRRSVRADAGRRLRRVLHDARGLLPAAAAGTVAARSRVRSGDLLHGLVQPVRAPPIRRRRVGAHPRRHQRHRAHRDPALARRSARSCSRPRARTTRSRSAGRWAPITRSTTRRRIGPPRSGGSPAKRGVDVVLDMVGGDYVERNLRVARDRRPPVADRVPAGQPRRDRHAARS